MSYKKHAQFLARKAYPFVENMSKEERQEVVVNRNDFVAEKIATKKKFVDKNEATTNAYLLQLREINTKRDEMYENRKLIKSGERISYRKRKFIAWQKRKAALDLRSEFKSA